MKRMLVVALGALVLTGCQGGGALPVNGTCQPEYVPFAFGATSNWEMIVGPAGCTDTLSLFGGMIVSSSITTPPANGKAFIDTATYGYTPNPGFTGTDKYVMQITGQGVRGTNTSPIYVTVKVRQ